MKVLIVTGIFFPDSGGPSIYLQNIIPELIKKSIEIKKIITLSEKIGNNSYFPNKVIRIKRNQNKFIRRLKTITQILIHSFGSDLIYVHGLELEAIIASKFLLNKKVIIKIVGDRIWEHAQNTKLTDKNINEFQFTEHKPKLRLLLKIRNLLFNRVDGIIVPSNYLKKIVEGWKLNHPEIKVIYNSANSNSIENPPPNKSFDVITVCRLVPWKGIEKLILSCIENNLTLNIVGDGPLEKELKLMSRDFLNNLIFFSGKISSQRVISEISKAKIFVLNSSYEGLPHVLIEAMKAKTPIIATKIGGNIELIQDEYNGLLITYGDQEELSKALNKLIKNKYLRERFYKNAEKNTLPLFQMKKMVSNTIDFFEEIINL